VLFFITFINNPRFLLRFYFVDNPIFVVYTKPNYKKKPLLAYLQCF
jgi:hypothetical protein